MRIKILGSDKYCKRHEGWDPGQYGKYVNGKVLFTWIQ